MKIKKILIIRNDHIGDMIQASCVFREIKKRYPKVKITVVASNTNRQIIEKNKNIDEIILMPHGKKFFKNFRDYPKVLKKIKKEKFDKVLDLRGDVVNSFFLMFLTGIKSRAGFYRNPFIKIMNTYSQKRNDNITEVENMLNIANKVLDLKSTNFWPEIAIDNEEVKQANDFIKKNKLKKFICIVPDSAHPLRQWPLKKFDTLIKQIRKNYPKYKIVLVGIDEGKINYLRNRNENLIWLGKCNLRMLLPFFKKSDLIITLDTGPMIFGWVSETKLILLTLKASIAGVNHGRPLGKNSFNIIEDKKEIEVEEVMRFIKNAIKKN
jgi:ADP-heptose:LPS heptosyltransferase